MPDLAIQVNRGCRIATVTIDGEIDAANAELVADAVHGAIGLARHTVVVDALGITFIDLAGRRALARLCEAEVAGVQILLLASAAMQKLDQRLDRSITPTATLAA